MPLTNNRRAVRQDGDAHLGDIDRGAMSAIFPGKDAAGLNGFTAPTVKAKYAVGLGNRQPAFDIRELAAVCLARANMPSVQVTLQGGKLFDREAHHFTLTLRTGSGLDRATPSIAAPVLRSPNKSCRF